SLHGTILSSRRFEIDHRRGGESRSGHQQGLEVRSAHSPFLFPADCCFQLWYNIPTMQNLWEEFDNKHSPASSETVGQGHHGRNRRLTERGILSSLRNWLLQDYVAPYCRSL